MTLTRRGFLQVTGAAVAAASGCGAPSEGTDDDAAVEPDVRSASDAGAGPDRVAPTSDTAPPPDDAPRPLDAGPRDVPGSRDAVAMDARPPAMDVRPPGMDVRPPGMDVRPADLELGSIPLSGSEFRRGVMAGDVTAARAMVWTRYAGDRDLLLRVIETSADGRTIRGLAFEGEVRVNADGFVHHDVGGLDAGAHYRYAFLERMGARIVGRSRIGRFRAAIADTDARSTLTFGGASCNNLNGAPFPAYRHALDADLDFFVHCGDHVYADAANNLAEYRGVYDRYWAVDGLSDLHAATGIYTTWDDHEVYNNWDAEEIVRLGREARLDAARRVFFEYRPIRRNSGAPDRIWRSFRWGRVAEVFVLDVRGERRRSRGEYISEAQLDWLRAGLRASNAVFKFIVTSKPITGRVPIGAENSREDYWESFRDQREALLRFVETIRGVVFLSGDVHYGAVARVEASGPYRDIREVYMGPGGSGEAMGAIDCTPGAQFDAVIHRHNFTRLRADPDTRRVEVAFIGAGGTSLCTRSFTV
ncbi:MAG: alkaline phosphatase D family protein [Polyangiales bacterium]